MAATRLPINLGDLLAHRTVESERIEYKAGWNPDPTIHTLCAFANDFENLGGGYIVIGLEAKDGYPGPDPSIKLAALNSRRIIARRYRNRRIGEFLKELKLTEGRCTGIPKIREAMKANGSAPPKFSTDRARTYFLVELPILPATKERAHDEAHEQAHDDLNMTEQKITLYLKNGPKSRPEIATHLGLGSRSGNLYKAIDRLREIDMLELTIAQKPRSKNQRMKLTAKGHRAAMRLSQKTG